MAIDDMAALIGRARYRAPLMIVFVITIFMCWVGGTEALRFQLAGFGQKCFSEDLMLRDSMVLGTYKLVDSDRDATVTAKVTSPHGAVLHAQHDAVSGQFAYSEELGTYTACFWITDLTRGTRATVDFSWKTGVAAKDWSSVAKRDKIDGVQLGLKKVDYALSQVQETMRLIKDREKQMDEAMQSTFWRISMLTILSLFTCLAVAGLQSWHLQTYFKKKKLL